MAAIHVHPLLEPVISRFILNPEVEQIELMKALKPLLDERIQQLPQQADVAALLLRLYNNGLELLQTDLKDHLTARLKVAGVYILDAIMSINDDSNSNRRIDVSNNVRKLVFENERLNLEFSEPIVRAAAILIGHFARISSAAEIEFLQRTYLELFFRLIVSQRADHLRFAGAVIAIQLSLNSPSLVFARRREVLARLWDTVNDKSPTVRLVSAEALEVVLQLVSQREDISEHLTNAIKIAVSGFSANSPDGSRIVGSLLIVSILCSGKIIRLELLKEAIQKCGMLIEDFIWQALQLFTKKLEVEAKNLAVILVPKLAAAFSKNFVTSNKYQAATFLNYSVKQLLQIVKSRKDAGVAFSALGQLFNCCVPLRTSSLVEEIFGAVMEGFNDSAANSKALECLGMVVHNSLPSRRLIDRNVIDAMFRGGLTVELLETLKVIIKHVPKVTKHLQTSMRTEINNILLRYAVVIDDFSDRAGSATTGRPVHSTQLSNPVFTRPLANTVPNGVCVGAILPTAATKPNTLPKTGSWFFHTNHSSDAVAANEKAVQASNIIANQQILLAMKLISSSGDFFDIDVGIDEVTKGSNQSESEVSLHSQLLVIARDGIARFLDDANETIRCTAGMSCISLFDHILPKIDSRSSDYGIMLRIVERILVMCVGDDSHEIRCRLLSALPPRLDTMVAMSELIGCLIDALNDESLSIRVASMSVLSRVAHFDLLRIMPIIRLSITNLVKQLKYSRFQLRRESLQMIEALVRGANTLIVPYVNQVLEPLVALLDDSTSSDLVGIILSTIGELAIASPESILLYIDRLFPRLIEALTSESSLVTREVAVMAMGKLVGSLTLLTDVPYAKFPALFGGLVLAIQCEDEGATELRLQAMRTMGLLGAVEQSVHQSRMRKGVADVDAFSLHDYSDDATDGGASGSMSEADLRFGTQPDYRPSNAAGNEPEKELKKSEKFNFSIVLRELTRIILDHSLTVHHQFALQTALKAVKHVGSRSFPFIDDLMKALIFRFKCPESSSSMRDQVLDVLCNLIYIIGKPIRVYQHAFVEIICESTANHLKSCLMLIEATYAVFSVGHFQTFLGDIIPTIIALCREEAMEVTRNATDQAMQLNVRSSSGKSKFDLPIGSLVMQTIANIKSKLGHFRKQLVHMIMTVLNNTYVVLETRRFALCVSIHLSEDLELHEYANRIIHPIIRIISSGTIAELPLQQAAVISLSTILCRIGADYLPFILPIRRCFKAQSKEFQRLPQVEEYESLVNRLLQMKPLPMGPSDLNDISVPEISPWKMAKGTAELPFQMSYQALETAWALADRDSQSDLVDWIERLSIELIRQCPSPLIRMCAPLTKAYKPLAEKLFNVSFCSIWDELYFGESTDVIDDIPIINSIEMALRSSQVPPHIVSVLLNLAEFMGMQDKRLPLDVPLLGRQAESANMFSKSLYYRELEFESRNITPTGECVEALISVANELGLGERARGVVAYVVQYLPNVEIRPLWLEKLQQWHDANNRYKLQNSLLKEMFPTEKPTRNPVWMASELGVMRCLHALGEYSELQKQAFELKEALKTSDVSENLQAGWLNEISTLGANASWMLGQWGALSQFVEGDLGTSPTHDVELNNNLNFYRAVLAIHDKKYEAASQLITTSRTQVVQTISTLLSENYSRAYRAMVSMEVLSEMEEVIEFKQSLERSKIELELSSPKVRTSIVGSARTPTHSSSHVELASISGHGSSNPHLAGLGAGHGNGSSFAAVSTATRAALIRKWNGRLRSAPKSVDTYRQLLAVHSLAVEPSEDLEGWLQLVSLCRQESRYTLCGNVLKQLGAPESPSSMSMGGFGSMNSSVVQGPLTTSTLQVHFATFNYWWMRGDRTVAANALSDLLENFPEDGYLNNSSSSAFPALTHVPSGSQLVNNNSKGFDMTSFRVQCLLKKAEWTKELGNRPMQEVLHTIHEARDLAPDDYGVWHAWAVANYNQLQKADSSSLDLKPQTGSAGANSGSFSGPNSGLLNQLRRPSPAAAAATGMPLPPLPMTSPAVTNVKGGLTSSKLSSQANNGKSPSQRNVRRASVSLANLMTYKQETDASSYVIEAIKGFARSIELGRNQPVAMVLQDTLRLLTLWFTYGTKAQVFQILSKEFERVSAEDWLRVVPQLIARMHVKSTEISGLLQKLLIKIATTHPQALVCPIYVALNTTDIQQKNMANEVVLEMRKINSQLVDEAILVSRELLQVAITPHEAWHDGLELAAQQYMEAKDTNAMLQTLLGLHESLNMDLGSSEPVDTTSDTFSIVSSLSNSGIYSANIPPKSTENTLREVSFKHSYGRQLADAHTWLLKFKESGRTTHLHQAWEVYQVAFKRIKAQISSLKKVELHHVSPALTGAVNLSLAVPGTYTPFVETVSITSFSPTVTVIASKQRPRKMSMIGSDGKEYKFLLKGHEDLRQDERVMQLFGLINLCFDNSQTTRNRGMEIVRYSVLPLSNNSGVIGWVDNCDTLNALIKQYREMKQVRLTLETKLLANKSSNYNKLTLMQKVEAFTSVLEETTGQDLSRMMWLKSRTADAWVERRAYFTRSLAVMSMVGYILGLGDRHPSNLMVDRISGRIVHIDFGDCFEVTAKRPKFPEIIPFRLTRMLQVAVGRSGIEGTFRVACERVMNVLRDNKDSVMAMLEAFVYDPLISWKLLGPGKDEDPVLSEGASVTIMSVSPVTTIMDEIQDRDDARSLADSDIDEMEKDDAFNILSPSAAGGDLVRRESMGGEEDGPAEDINSRALEVITRIQAKLTGRDFAKSEVDPDLTVEKQVDRLIKEATNVENLCQLYQGWCPLW